MAQLISTGDKTDFSIDESVVVQEQIMCTECYGIEKEDII